MATVYLAEDREMHRQVAIKVLDPEVASEVDPARFEREIRIAAELEHPNILPLLDSGEADGFLFLVMPYVDGGSLGERISREGQMGVDEVIRVARDIAAGLDHAHGHDVVHRDIKPENVLLSGDRVYVADFGIARLLTTAESARLTTAGRQVGTPAYASPEQSAGETRIDKRSDIYSLGCVLYEMLAGEPPFTGPTPRAVIARHITATPPDLTVIRPGLSASVVAATRRALCKAPSDRFATAGELAAALDSPVPVRVPGDPRPAKRRTGIALAFGVVVVSLLIARSFLSEAGELDAHKVVVFPLAPTSAITAPSVGWDVALAIEAALEHTEPLKFIDGYTWLDSDHRADPSLVTANVADAIARARGAAYYIAGAILGVGDSVQVILRLHDVRGDSLVVQETEKGGMTTAPPIDLGLRAVGQILGILVDPGIDVDLTPLTDRSLAANALSIQGDRAYRQSHFAEALSFYTRAVEEDSLHVFAAVKGAQAASWLSDFGDAGRLSEQALAHADLLPDKYRRFAEGVEAYLRGDAERAVAAFEAAMAIDDEWREGAMALGDTYFHLLPVDAVAPDSMAEDWLRRATQYDPTFGPPFFHLAELALRRGDIEQAGGFMQRWEAFRPDTILVRQLQYSLECLVAGSEGFDWAALAPASARPVLQAGMSLSGGAAQVACANGAFTAVFEADALHRSLRWTALKGLFGLAMARGRYQEADSLLQLALAMPDLSAAVTLYVYGALGGGPFVEHASRTEARLRRAAGDLYTGQPTRFRWLMGVWLSHTGELGRVEALTEDMASHADQVDDREERLLARALRAHLLAARGDTAAAVSLLRDLLPDGPRDAIAFSEQEALAPERMLLAEMLLAQGDGQGAFQAAALLDHSQPLIYLTFLRQSLIVRLRAAQQIQQPALVEAVRSRLADLEWIDSDYPPLVSP